MTAFEEPQYFYCGLNSDLEELRIEIAYLEAHR